MRQTLTKYKKGSIAISLLCVLAFFMYFVQYKAVASEVLKYAQENPFHRFHIMNSSTLLSPHPHIYQNTITIIPINSGMLRLAKNTLCSLARVDPTLPSRITIWAMNEAVVTQLQDWNTENEQIYNATTYGQDNSNAKLGKKKVRTPISSVEKKKEILPVHGFAVFFDQNYTGVSQEKYGWTPEYLHMMLMRRTLYSEILKKINLLFMDGDLVFFEDPYKDIGITDNFSGRSDTSKSETMWVPDFIYAPDPKDHHKYLQDPYEFSPYIPKVCGCFFFARANHRTAAVMQKLANSTWNDQEGMDRLFNVKDEGHCNVLLDPLPRGLPRKIHDTIGCLKEDRLRIQILDSGKYAGGQLFLKHKDHYEKEVEMLETEGDRRVFVHPNLWEWNFNKSEVLKKEGYWFLDENDMCVST